MELAVDNYLDLTIDEVYDVIMNVNLWPRDFDTNKKRKFLNSMIKYFILVFSNIVSSINTYYIYHIIFLLFLL